MNKCAWPFLLSSLQLIILRVNAVKTNQMLQRVGRVVISTSLTIAALDASNLKHSNWEALAVDQIQTIDNMKQAGSSVSALGTLADKLAQSQSSDDVEQVLSTLAERTPLAETAPKESMKYRIIEAIQKQRSALGHSWTNKQNTLSKEVKHAVDPFHTVDLASYLSVAPYIGGAAYLAALTVQRVAPLWFYLAYPSAVALVILPMLYKLAAS